MSSFQPTTPKLVTPRYAREHLIGCGRTKFWALVKNGKIRMVDVGIGRPMVDAASIDALISENQAA